MSAPAHLTACPRAGCARPPLPIFCPQDWMLISGPTRNAIIRHWKKLHGKGTRAMPKRFVELIHEGVREIARVST